MTATTRADAVAQFRDAIARSGLTPPDSVEADGELHRFASNGKRSDDSGWYLLHEDGIPAGAYGDWRTGVSQTWRADIGRRLSPAEEAAHRARVDAMRRQRDAEQERRHAEARERAARIWRDAKPAPADHPYLARKGIQPHGARVIEDGRLVIPMRDAGGELHSLQFIDGDGEKRFLPGGRVHGCYFAIGKPTGKICIAEGYATGASVHEATGHAVAVAFNAGNLPPVAMALREKYPDATLILCADDDYRADGNPGLIRAREAARAVGGLVALPEFGEDRPEGATDMNDLAQHRGAEAVRECIERACAPDADDAHATAGGASDEWPEPRPLPDGLAPVAAFDVAMLPTALRAWVSDIAERVQCPPDFVAVAAVTALGAVLGRKVAIRPQAHTDWSEVANQWGLIIGRPGVLKSPAIEQAMLPLRRLEAVAREGYAAVKAAHEAGLKVLRLRAKANQRAAEKALAKNRGADVSDLLHDEEETDPPTCRRYSTSDTSCESLAELVRQNPNGILVHRDEIVSLLRDLDREERAGARGLYLSGWNGSTSYTVDRIGRGFDLHIPAVCLSLLGSTQPARIAEYVHAATHGGRGDDGLIQRFGLMVWPDIGGDWRNVDRWPDSEARAQAFGAYSRLDECDPTSVGAVQDTGFDGSPEGVPYLRFAADALDLFVGWRTDLERRLRSDELAPAVVSHLHKYRKLVPALAITFHLADGHTGPVGTESLLRALAWAEYLETHAARVYGSGPASEAATARAILARIRKGDLPSTFGSRDVWRPGWAGLADRDAVANGIALLVDLDYLRGERIETGGRTATRYTANPRAIQ